MSMIYRSWVARRVPTAATLAQGRGVAAIGQELCAVLRVAQGRQAAPSAALFDSRTLPSTLASGTRAGYDGAQRRWGSKVHRAVDTLGPLLARHVTAANAQDRSPGNPVAAHVQEATGDTVAGAFGDQGDTGEQAAQAPHRRLEMVELPEANKGFVLSGTPGVATGDTSTTRLDIDNEPRSGVT